MLIHGVLHEARIRETTDTINLAFCTPALLFPAGCVIYYRNEVVMPMLADEEADALDTFSAEHLKAMAICEANRPVFS
ncbi:MAG: hypothetical protein LBE10_11090 [Treponema sp.]|jgi:hypothetical protein|nr:hypothetical protein [Treponema sp.]